MSAFKTFATVKSAKSRIRKAGLHLIPHEFLKDDRGRCFPKFYPELHEDKTELNNRGFAAEFNMQKHAIFMNKEIK